jgi:membrane protein YqaA with SNARE-associated domain
MLTGFIITIIGLGPKEKMNDKVRGANIHWVRLVLLAAIFLLASFVLGYFLQGALAKLHIPMDRPFLAYVLVFVVCLVVNLSVLPLPFGISIMIAAAEHWNPVAIALVGSAGASLGEFSGYLIGYLGKKLAIKKEIVGYGLMQRWIKKYGVWAIAFLSFQPILPIEIGGFIAGVARMPVHQFLPALWAGKFPKYVLLVYAGIGLFHLFPGFINI